MGKRSASEDATNSGGAGADGSAVSSGAGDTNGATSAAVVAAAMNSAALASAALSLNGPASVSAVWSYFEKDSLGNSVCKFCERVIKGHHSSNLLSHLRTAGRTDAAHQQANSACEEHRENKRAVKKHKGVTPADLVAVYPQLAAALAAGTTSAPFPALPKSRNAAHMAFSAFQAAGELPVATATASSPAASAALTKDQREAGYHVYGPSPTITLSHDQIAQDLGTSCSLCTHDSHTIAKNPTHARKSVFHSVTSSCGHDGQLAAELCE